MMMNFYSHHCYLMVAIQLPIANQKYYINGTDYYNLSGGHPTAWSEADAYYSNGTEYSKL